MRVVHKQIKGSKENLCGATGLVSHWWAEVTCNLCRETHRSKINKRDRERYQTSHDNKRRRKYREENHSKLKEYGSQYYQVNCSKLKDRRRQYCEANRSKVNLKRCQQRDASKISAQNRKYREANLSSISEKQRQYREANRFSINGKNRKCYYKVNYGPMAKVALLANKIKKKVKIRGC